MLCTGAVARVEHNIHANIFMHIFYLSRFTFFKGFCYFGVFYRASPQHSHAESDTDVASLCVRHTLVCVKTTEPIIELSTLHRT